MWTPEDERRVSILSHRMSIAATASDSRCHRIAATTCCTECDRASDCRGRTAFALPISSGSTSRVVQGNSKNAEGIDARRVVYVSLEPCFSKRAWRSKMLAGRDRKKSRNRDKKGSRIAARRRRSGPMRRPDNEIAVRIRGRHVAIRQFLRLDVTRRMRIAHRRLAASLGGRIFHQEGQYEEPNT